MLPTVKGVMMITRRLMSKKVHDPDKRYRPLGLSIAIISTAVIYGLYQMVPILAPIWLRIIRPDSTIAFTELVGGWLGIGSVILGAITFIASILAWIGRPRGVRLMMLVMVWISTVLTIIRAIQGLTPQAPTIGEVGTNFNIPPFLILCQLPVLLFVPLYVTWYLNRAPARAFYAPRALKPPMSEKRLDSPARSQ